MPELSPDQYARVIYLGLLILAVGGWVIVEFRSRLGRSLRSFAGWGLIFIGLMAGYGLWQDMRLTLPPSQSVKQGGEIRLPRAVDGHYYAQLDIGGKTVMFMVDTGASTVSLSQKDAARLGIDVANLAYIGRAQTANGTIRTAQVTLSNVKFGPYKDSKVLASVGDGELQTSLLGMSYLDRFQITLNASEMILSR